ncbi:MAG: TIGR03086 family protein [Candidatus Dormibacteraeota bacterium]|nr:TIGR03086 family protein [Candidatus Dormibacteraeota bacterium]
MNNAEAFQRATDAFIERARLIGANQWTASTPCAEWDVRALVNHVGGEWLWVAELMSGKTIADVGSSLDGDVLGDDPVQTVAAGRASACAAFDAPGAAEKSVQLSFGDTPAMEYAQQMAADTVIHTWDLARAIGAGEALDPDLVDYTYAYMLKVAELWRSGGAFGPPCAPHDDSPQAKLLALTGR